MTAELSTNDVFGILGSISGDPSEEGFVIRFDAIQHEGETCIVASWLISQDGTHKLPERIICLHPGRLNPASDDPDVRYTLRDPMPRSVLEGRERPQDGYTVVELPDIRVWIRSPDGGH